MAMSTQRARQLAAVLRDVREKSKVSAREVARQLHISHTKVNRWLTGETVPDPEDVSAFLAIIGVAGEERDRILRMARSTETDWLVSGPPGINPQLASVMECERDAVRITECNPLVIPGLLQTSDYARAVIVRSGRELHRQEIEMRVMVRIARRDALSRRQPVTFDALIGLPALNGGIGGPAVMADQLQHVREAGERSNVTVRAFDLSGDWTAAHDGSFIIYEFSDMPPLVYLEHYRSGAFISDESDVAAYQTAAEETRREAMSPDVTAGLIADVIPTLETTI